MTAPELSAQERETVARFEAAPVLPEAWEFARITAELREDMWMPRQTYPCGCNHAYICPGHADRRAVDHYHPETIR